MGKSVFIETIKDKKEKYGRYLGEIWLENCKGQLININDELVNYKFAKYQKY